LYLEGERAFKAHVAQAVEHFLGKEEVTGSSPVVGSSITDILGQASEREFH
jgi:hypothetical protein